MYNPRYERNRRIVGGAQPPPIMTQVCRAAERQRSQERYSITKPFPNNYTRLTLHPEYIPNGHQILIDENTESFLGCTTTSGKSRCYRNNNASSEAEIRLASMRIFATIMLNAWRRRREDVKRLLIKVEDMKRGSMKAKNQIHVYNTLFRVEQKRNDELACQLKCSLESIIHAKSSCESLTTSVISLKADKALLEQELHTKNQELEALSDILNQTKSQLFQSMLDQRNLRSILTKEQRSVHALENQKNKLINELYQLTHENRTVQEKYNIELIKKEVDLEHTNFKLRGLESRLADLQQKACQVDECTINDSRLKHEVEHLQKRIDSLQVSLDQTLGQRISIYWHRLLCYRHRGLYMIQTFMYLLLPAVPLPRVNVLPYKKPQLMLDYDAVLPQ